MNPHQRYPISLTSIFHSYWRNRELIWQMTKRDVIGRYRGSVMGIAWSFFNPVLMLAVYTFVFSMVFKSRWGVGGEESRTDFAIILFVGMIVHSLFAECINRAPGLVISNPNYVKKVVFPLEILPFVAMGSTLFHTAISFVVLVIFYFFLHTQIHWTIVFIPLILLPLILASLGFAWILASLGVFIRDIGQATTILTTILLFLSPVFYPISILPSRYQLWMHLNPLTYMIEETRSVFIWGQLPNWAAWCTYTAISFMTAWLGFWWFQRTRKGFADVI
ncbi:MAG: ABC transporter permease [Candidatus Competibacteraceae bacterium]